MLLLKSYSKTTTRITLKNIPLKTLGKLQWLFLIFSLNRTKIAMVMFFYMKFKINRTAGKEGGRF